MNEKVDELINKAIDNLVEQDEEIKEKKKELIEVVNSQVEKFIELAEKVSPLIMHNKEKKYIFNSKEFNCHSLVGPVIGRQDDVMYIYEGKGNLVTRFNLNNENKDTIILAQFFRENPFSPAMEALLSVLEIQTDTIKDYEEEIQKKQEELNEY